MNASKLNKRITITRPITTISASGQQTITEWEPFAQAWANVRPLRGTEKFEANQIGNTVTHKITVRYRDDIDEGMRLCYDQKELDIKTIINVREENRWLEIEAVEHR
jgi:SPP1 family predicted phage head-tail adaptor